MIIMSPTPDLRLEQITPWLPGMILYVCESLKCSWSSFADECFRFGGTNGTEWFNDVWEYHARSQIWKQLDCIGYIPEAREGHASAVCNDFMYVFGGRNEEGNDLGDLAAFHLPACRWYIFQNMGPSPSPRSGHSMTCHGSKLYIVGGEPNSSARDEEELKLLYVLDTSKIKYPTQNQINKTRSGERVTSSS